MDWGHGIVSRELEVLNGDLAFAGTRVPVKNLVDYLSAGDTLDEFLDNFPGVSRDQAEGYLRLSLRASEESVGPGLLDEMLPRKLKRLLPRAAEVVVI